MAERMGFEPMEEFDPFTHFPGELLRPLRHLSAYVVTMSLYRRRTLYPIALAMSKEMTGKTGRTHRGPIEKSTAPPR